jgi:hypothetical protein
MAMQPDLRLCILDAMGCEDEEKSWDWIIQTLEKEDLYSRLYQQAITELSELKEKISEGVKVLAGDEAHRFLVSNSFLKKP